MIRSYSIELYYDLKINKYYELTGNLNLKTSFAFNDLLIVDKKKLRKA